MVSKANLVLQTQIVAIASVDSTQLRGEGGALAPNLVVPLEVELLTRPNTERLALQRITAELWLPPTAGYASVAPPLTVFGDSHTHGVFHSSDQGSRTQSFDLRFTLTPETLRLIEDAAHRVEAASAGLQLRISPSFAHVRGEENLVSEAGMPGQKHLLGQAFDLWSLPGLGLQTLSISISREQWAERLAPAFGLNSTRLVPIRLPKSVEGLDDKLVAMFDQAAAAYERRDYRGAIQGCRDIRELAEQSLGAQGEGSVADIVAKERQLEVGSPEHQLLDDAWKLFVDFTNTAKHARSHGHYASADARAGLLITAVLLEYLADSLRRRLA